MNLTSIIVVTFSTIAHDSSITTRKIGILLSQLQKEDFMAGPRQMTTHDTPDTTGPVYNESHFILPVSGTHIAIKNRLLRNRHAEYRDCGLR